MVQSVRRELSDVNHISAASPLYLRGRFIVPAGRAVSHGLTVTDKTLCRLRHVNLGDLAQHLAGLWAFYVGIGEMRPAGGAYGVAGSGGRHHIAGGRDAWGVSLAGEYLLSAGLSG